MFTVPEPAPRHDPEMAKHPAPRLIPLANVEEAVDEVTLNTLACNPPANVEVADVELAVKKSAMCEATVQFTSPGAQLGLSVSPGVKGEVGGAARIKLAA